MSSNKIILITSLVDLRARKRRELQFYQEQLEELNLKMGFIRREIELTTYIMNLIEHEKLLDLKALLSDHNP